MYNGNKDVLFNQMVLPYNHQREKILKESCCCQPQFHLCLQDHLSPQKVPCRRLLKHHSPLCQQHFLLCDCL